MGPSLEHVAATALAATSIVGFTPSASARVTAPDDTKTPYDPHLVGDSTLRTLPNSTRCEPSAFNVKALLAATHPDMLVELTSIKSSRG